MRYRVYYKDGRIEATDQELWLMADSEMRERGIVTIDQWSESAQDYLEVRRVR